MERIAMKTLDAIENVEDLIEELPALFSVAILVVGAINLFVCIKLFA